MIEPGSGAPTHRQLTGFPGQSSTTLRTPARTDFSTKPDLNLDRGLAVAYFYERNNSLTNELCGQVVARFGDAPIPRANLLFNLLISLAVPGYQGNGRRSLAF